jgi:DNA-binding SARP family transcriptional activator
VADLRFRVLGAFQVVVDGVPLRDRAIGSRKGRTLLKLLVVERPHVVSVDRIAEVLWEGEPPADAERHVAPLVSRLRGILGPSLIAGGRAGYRIATGDEVVDVDEAGRLVEEAEGRLSHGEHSLASIAAGQALNLLGTGAILEEEPYAEWAEDARAEAQQLLWRARKVAWLTAPALGNHDAALAAAGAALATDPMDEEAARAVMRAHQGRGSPAAALAAFEALRAELANELGTDPSPETTALHLAILRGAEDADDAPAQPEIARGVARDPGFVGRDEQLALLRERWAAAVGSRANLVLLMGEAGIGKTRLAVEAADEAARTGGLVLQTRCFEVERSLFLQPMADAIRTATLSLDPGVVRVAAGVSAPTLAELVPELTAILRPEPAAPAEPRVHRRRTFEGVVGFFKELARHRALLLVIDDLHLASSAMLELIHLLIRRVATERVLVVGTLRIEESKSALARLADVAERIDVGPLSAAAVRELARSMGAEAMADLLLERTGGHTLFVVEALHAIRTSDGAEEIPVPDSLREAVLDRVERAGPDVEELLRGSAILGPSFDLDLATALLELSDEDAARRAEAALDGRLLVESGTSYAFTNELVQEVLYDSVSRPTRIVRHRRAAALLAENPEAMATHAEAAGDQLRAAEGYLAAGEHAEARFANDDARALFDRALAAATVLDDPRLLIRIRLARGRIREVAIDYEEAHAEYVEGIRLARVIGDRRAELHCLRALGGDLTVGRGGRTKDCVPYLEEALAIAEELEDPTETADVLCRLTVIATNRLRFDEAYADARRALEIGRSHGDEALIHGLDAMKNAAAYAGDIGTLRRILPEADLLARRPGAPWYVLQWVVFESAFVPLAEGDWDRAVTRILDAFEVGRRAGRETWNAMGTSYLGWIARARGDHSAALRYGRTAIEEAEAQGHPWWIAFARAMLAETLLEVRANAEAVGFLEHGLAAAERDGAEAWVLHCLGPLTLARWRAGDAEGSLDTARRAESIVRESTAPPGLTFLHGGHAILDVAEMRLLRGDLRLARGLAETVARGAERAAWREFEGRAALILGRALALGGDPSASELFRRGIELGDLLGWPRLSWEARAALSQTGSDAVAEEAQAEARYIVAGMIEGLEAEPILSATFARAAAAELDGGELA